MIKNYHENLKTNKHSHYKRLVQLPVSQNMSIIKLWRFCGWI